MHSLLLDEVIRNYEHMTCFSSHCCDTWCVRSCVSVRYKKAGLSCAVRAKTALHVLSFVVSCIRALRMCEWNSARSPWSTTSGKVFIIESPKAYFAVERDITSGGHFLCSSSVAHKCSPIMMKPWDFSKTRKRLLVRQGEECHPCRSTLACWRTAEALSFIDSLSEGLVYDD